jgi:thiamine-phosphate pyrophosphorylase
MPAVYRIIDANANRAREALRVMEEAARFILDHDALTAGIKALRHDLASALAGLSMLDANRDTPGDVGTTISTTAEMHRDSAAHVARAAGKRLSEALRAIEEYAKTLPTPAGTMPIAARVEQLRYRGYDIEQRLNAAMIGSAARQHRLCVLLTQSLCKTRRWADVLNACVDNGADCIQLREKELEAGPLMELAALTVAICRPAGVTVIVNDRPDVALAAGADGVHLGQHDLPCNEVRKLVGTQLLVGVSTSKLAEAKLALEAGADYCGVGPMFPTTTKHKDVIAGPEYLREFVAWGKLPHLAIGGITPENLAPLIDAGVRGVAVSSVVCGGDDPAGVVRKLIAALP